MVAEASVSGDIWGSKAEDNQAVPSDVDLVLRLLLASALAGLLGLERELTEQPAGFRTHILVGLGSALFAIISAFGFQAVVGPSPQQAVTVDVTRVASQIVVGIGFLGGGAILKYGANVRGLTTAANLWVTAAVGTAIGIGMLMLGTATAVITLAALAGLRPLRRVVRRYGTERDEFTIDARKDVNLDDLLERVRESGGSVMEFRVSEDEEEARTIQLAVRLSRNADPADLVARLAHVPNVRNVDWNR
jgi:putative Mg2+ transporter-C (MgtC) family protein